MRMHIPVLKHYMFRTPLREGSIYIAWILLILKTTLWIYTCVALADMCEAVSLDNDVMSGYKGSDERLSSLLSLRFKKVWDGISSTLSVLSIDMIVYLLEMLISFVLLIGITSKKWRLLKFFYVVYPFFIAANIVITGFRISIASPMAIMQGLFEYNAPKLLILSMLPFERFIRSLIIGFSCFELYSVLVVRSCYLKRSEESDGTNLVYKSYPYNPTAMDERTVAI